MKIVKDSSHQHLPPKPPEVTDDEKSPDELRAEAESLLLYEEALERWGWDGLDRWGWW